MIIHSFEIMVVLVVALIVLGTVLKARYRAAASHKANPGATEALEREVRGLKDRVAVLERIATDKNHLLEQEIERLRDPSLLEQRP